MLVKGINKAYDFMLKLTQNLERSRAYKKANPLRFGTKVMLVFLSLCTLGLLAAMDNSLYTWWDFFEGIWYGLKNGSLSW